MKRPVSLISFVLLFLLLIFVGSCTKTEDPIKPDVQTAAPAAPSSSQTPSSIAKKTETSAEVMPAPAIPDAPKPPSPPSVPTAVQEVPTTPAAQVEKDVVLVAGFASPQMQQGAPAGWLLDRKKGTPSLTIEKGSNIYCLQMRSDEESAFGVKRGIKVDIKEYPYLNWRWKVDRLPIGGDVRNADKDDQAIQLYVAFTPAGFPAALNTPVLGYIWDSEAPKGWTGRSSQVGGGKLRYVVVRNKTDQLGHWYTEKRNIYDDYRNLLKDVKSGEPQGVTHGVQLYINSQNTKSSAESSICEVYFSKK